MRRMTGRRFWRGSATLFGAIVLGAFAALFMASWYGAQAVLFRDEHDRERGRMWGLTCMAAHRAVQAGLVTAPGAAPPGPVTAPAALTVAQLRAPPTPFQPFLPAGMQTVDEPGALQARYGAVMVDGVPMAVCSLAGSGVASRHPALRAGAVMAGMDVVGEVGGPGTAMHARLAAVQGVLGTLPQGSLFATADFGLAHAVERVHRRAVGGRPELAAMDREIVFDSGQSMVGVGTAGVETAEAASGAVPATGNANVRGDVVLRQDDPLKPAARLTMPVLPTSPPTLPTVSATGGFAFGGAQTAFTIPRELGVGTSMRSRGAVAAGRMTLTGALDAGGNVEATGPVTGQAVSVTREASAETGSINSLRVDSCNGCTPPTLGP